MHPNHVQPGHDPSIPPNNPPPVHNGHHQSNGAPHHPLPHRNNIQHPPKEPVTVLGIPSVTVENDQLLVGDSQSSSTRSYTPLKVVGDGSFGTVWLCDWHGTLPPNTPLSAMQCGQGARQEYSNKRLVAVKRMKKRWEGGWDECKRLKELESLRAIPYHPNIIPLYDFFLLPTTKELYFVFESMEGNLYQLIKTRKGKPLAGGLVSSIFEQVVSGLHHIHTSGYFHRDMKPENLLVTTTGLYDYRPLGPISPDTPPDRDVVVIIKLADFGLARETRSKPPYTEYVSTRWYRAPEVLLKSRDYSSPVDMWAFGTIMAELVNLRPLFPGSGEIDQVARICDLLGDPVDDYGVDPRGKTVGGGRWPRGVKMAKAVGFAFQKILPKNFYSLFDRSIPLKLVDCIADLLRYDPAARLTSEQCLTHPYLLETRPLNDPPGPPTQSLQSLPEGYVRPYANGNGVSPATSLRSVAPRNLPPSHSHHSLSPRMHPTPPHLVIPPLPDASSSHRSPFFPPVPLRTRTNSDPSQRSTNHSTNGFNAPYGSRLADAAHQASWSMQQRDLDAMDVSPQIGHSSPMVPLPFAMDIQMSPLAQEYTMRPVAEPEPIHDNANPTQSDATPSQGNRFPKLGSLGFGKKPSKWGLSMFGHGDKHAQNHLPPVQESATTSAESTPSLKRTNSTVDSRSLPEIDPIHDNARSQHLPPLDEKARKKEAQRMAEEAERQRRARVREMQVEQARNVMKNKRRLAEAASGKEFQYLSHHGGLVKQPYVPRQIEKGKSPAPAATGPIRQTQSHGPSPAVQAAGGNFFSPDLSSHRSAYRGDSERVAKARRREFDDDHSMSSSDLPSGVSVISFTTNDSDPGPTRVRHRPSILGMSRMTSMSSLRPSSIDDFPSSGRSSNSLSLDQQFANDFHLRASVDSSSISDGGSPHPLPLHALSLSSPIPWQHSDASSSSTVDNRSIGSGHQTLSSPLYSPQVQPLRSGNYKGSQSPYDPPGVFPPSPGVAPKSAINPIFKVDKPALSLSLPPFSQLEAVADGEYPPLSPMSFTIPEDVDS